MFALLEIVSASDLTTKLYKVESCFNSRDNESDPMPIFFALTVAIIGKPCINESFAKIISSVSK